MTVVAFCSASDNLPHSKQTAFPTRLKTLLTAHFEGTAHLAARTVDRASMGRARHSMVNAGAMAPHVKCLLSEMPWADAVQHIEASFAVPPQ